jgi:hypothetical protein
MARQAELFDKPKRKSPRVLAKLVDAGTGVRGGKVCHYVCRSCGWDSGWVEESRPDSEIMRGLPCEVCNQKKEGGHQDA